MMSLKTFSMCLLLTAILYCSNAAPHPTLCPDVLCSTNLCEFAICPAFKDAECVFDCECRVQWFRNGYNVTDQCKCSQRQVRAPPVTLPTTDKECSTAGISGQEYSTCGPAAACTPTCANPNPICTLQCVEGCHCPLGHVLHEDGCILEKDCH